jgi:pilus assembly protein Flp/PilA
MLKQISKFLKSESGAAAVEYGLITSGIGIVIIPAVNGVGNKLTALFLQIQNAL